MEDVNGRTTQRNTCRRGSVEVWWRLHLHDLDLYYRFLGTRIRELLIGPIGHIGPILLLPADDEFLGLLPNWKVRWNRAPRQLLRMIEQYAGASDDGADRIVRHRGPQFQFRLQAALQSFQ